MSTVHGGQGNIVRNGLVLNLDAANPRSYPPPYIGTTWTDLSGNGNNGTLVNGVGYNSSNGGSLVFDGINDNVTLGTIFNYTSENFSFSYWAYFNSLTTNQSGQGPIVLWKGNYRINGYYDQVSTTGSIAFITNQSGVEQISRTPINTIIINRWYNICYTRSGSSVRIYVNGIDSNSESATHINPNSAPSNIFRLGVYNVTQIWGNFRLANFLSYNRALSASEVLQNFNATRARFGV